MDPNDIKLGDVVTVTTDDPQSSGFKVGQELVVKKIWMNTSGTYAAVDFEGSSMATSHEHLELIRRKGQPKLIAGVTKIRHIGRDNFWEIAGKGVLTFTGEYCNGTPQWVDLEGKKYKWGVKYGEGDYWELVKGDDLNKKTEKEVDMSREDVVECKFDGKLNNRGETSMSKRRIVTVELIDNDAGLPVEHSVVEVFNNIVTEDDDNTTIQELLMTKPVEMKLKAHNKLRSETVNEDILNRTGQEVKLRPVKLKDLTWVVK